MTPVRTAAIVAALVGSLAGCSKDPEAAKREYVASGERFAAEGKDAEAIIQYQNALQQDPRFGEARLKLAEIYERLGNVQGAGREYIRAADLLPNRADVQLKAASVLLYSRQFEDAKTRAAKVLAIDPRNAQAHVVVGSAMAGLKDFDAAVAELEEANKLEPSAVAHANLGTVRLAEGDRASAEAAFKKAIEVEPRNVTAYFALANFQLAANQRSEAESTLKRALELEPSNRMANRALAALYLGDRRMAQAEPYLKALATSDSTQEAASKLALADFFAVTKRPADAMRVLEPLKAAKGSSAQAQTRIAVLLYQEGKTAEARQTIDGVLAAEPKNALALLTKARFLLIEQQVDASLELARQAVAAAPRSIDAHYFLGNIHLLRNEQEEAAAAFSEVLKLNPRAVAAQFQLSKVRLARGEANAAQQLAESAVRGAPGASGPQLVLVKSLIAQRQYDRANTAIRTLLVREPNFAAAHSTAGTLAIFRNDRPEARRSYERALALDRDDLEALNGLSALDVAAGKPEPAIARVEALLARSPEKSEFVTLAAQTYGKLGRFDRAEELLKGLIERDPKALVAYAQLARVYFVQGKLNQARSELDRIVEKNPKSVGARTMAAMILDSQGSTAEARRRYEEILQIEPRAAVAANNLAYLYAETGGNLEVALQLAQDARGQMPRAPEVADTLGYVYLKKGLPEMALAPLSESVNSDPANAVYSYHLGLAHLGAGDKAKARQYLERALSMSPSFRGAEDARKTLATL